LVLEKIFKDRSIFGSFSLPVWKLFGIPQPYEQILENHPRYYIPAKKLAMIRLN
jgi:hypothetical protein